MGQSWPLLVYFCPFLKTTTNIAQQTMEKEQMVCLGLEHGTTRRKGVYLAKAAPKVTQQQNIKFYYDYLCCFLLITRQRCEVCRYVLFLSADDGESDLGITSVVDVDDVALALVYQQKLLEAKQSFSLVKDSAVGCLRQLHLHNLCENAGPLILNLFTSNWPKTNI